MFKHILWSEGCVIKWGGRLRVFIWIQSCIKLQKCLYPIMVAGTVAVHSKPHFPEFSLLYDYRLNLDRRGICLLFGSLKGKVAEKSVKVKVTQCIQLLVTPWTVTCQAALSMEFCRREHHFFLPGILPPQGSTLGLLYCRGDSLPSEPPGSQEGHWRLPWLNRVTRVAEDGGTGGDNAAYPRSLLHFWIFPVNHAVDQPRPNTSSLTEDWQGWQPHRGRGPCASLPQWESTFLWGSLGKPHADSWCECFSFSWEFQLCILFTVWK